VFAWLGRPDDESWEQLRPIIENRGYLINIDTAQFPGAARLRPAG